MLRTGRGEGLGTIRRHVQSVNISDKIAELGFNTADIKFRLSLGKSNAQTYLTYIKNLFNCIKNGHVVDSRKILALGLLVDDIQRVKSIKSDKVEYISNLDELKGNIENKIHELTELEEKKDSTALVESRNQNIANAIRLQEKEQARRILAYSQVNAESNRDKLHQVATAIALQEQEQARRIQAHRQANVESNRDKLHQVANAIELQEQDQTRRVQAHAQAKAEL